MKYSEEKKVTLPLLTCIDSVQSKQLYFTHLDSNVKLYEKKTLYF